MQSTSGSRPNTTYFSSLDSEQFLLSFNSVLHTPLSLASESRNAGFFHMISKILNRLILLMSYLKQVYQLVSWIFRKVGKSKPSRLCSIFQNLYEHVLINLQNNISFAVLSTVTTTLSLA